MCLAESPRTSIMEVKKRGDGADDRSSDGLDLEQGQADDVRFLLLRSSKEFVVIGAFDFWTKTW